MPDILIVEDGLKERERLEQLFLKADYTVNAVDTASKAESLLDLKQYRLCLLDIGLSDKSGSLLFDQIIRKSPKPLVLILTGNPSVYLKQKFIEEGAAGFILKGSAEAESKNLLNTIQSLLGSSSSSKDVLSIELEEFLKLYIPEISEDFFLNEKGNVKACSACSGTNIIVRFSHKTQLPPLVEGEVVCQSCSEPYDIKVGK